MEKTVFTNGCFDLIHAGHIELLEKAKKLGTKLIVGINGDESVKKIKGSERPFQNQDERKKILESLRTVDEVFIFDELTPENLIFEIKPDVLVKGGDWKENEIIGADFVKQNGGEVVTIPLKNGFSTSRIVEKIKKNQSGASDKIADLEKFTGDKNLIVKSIEQHIEVFQKILNEQIEQIQECAELLYETIARGNKIMVCGNGGSAADAQHFAAEFVGRFETERRALPAIALTTDTSALTAISNDYGFETVFSRQTEALAAEGDCLVAISTSGNSPNVIKAVMEARKKGCKIIGMTGSGGKKLASLSDGCIFIEHPRTARIQEAHITIIHILCEFVDKKISEA